MNPIKIEKGAIIELKNAIRLHEKMDEFISENDKEPSWDGDIYLYSDNDLKVEHIKYRIPTQVKGKNDEKLLKRNSITYPVEYRNLRNYRNDGGVCYFVIIISNDGRKSSIFYNTLTPIKLEAYLKGTDKKKPEQTKSIPLLRLKNNDKDELHKILLQFGFDCKEQGAGELVRKAISLKDMEKIDSIRTTTFASTEQEAIKYVRSGEACLYGHLAEADIWVPFAYEIQKSMNILSKKMINKPLKIDEKIYYEKFVMTKDLNDMYIIQLSDNLSLNTKTNKVNFESITELDEIIKDVNFLKGMEAGNKLYIGNDILATFDNVVFDNGLREIMEFYIKLKQAVDEFEIKLLKRVADFDEDDWIAIGKLIALWDGDIKPKEETAWYMWWWQGKVIPFFVGTSPEGKLIVDNALHLKYIKIFVGAENKYRVPAFLLFKRDVWEKLYNLDEKNFLDELEISDINSETENDFSLAFLEVLAAYDVIKNEKYYCLAEKISERLLMVSPDNKYWIINKFQILARKRELLEKELQEIENMEQMTEDKKLQCAINILLDNKRKAKKILEVMTEEDRKIFMTYPIFNLL